MRSSSNGGTNGELTNKVAKMPHWCGLNFDATYLVNEHTSCVVTPTNSLGRLRQLIMTTTPLAKSWIRAWVSLVIIIVIIG